MEASEISESRQRGDKYIEGYLEKKVDAKWVNYWVVLRGTILFFFKDPNTHLQGNLSGGLELGVKCGCSPGKNKKSYFEFDVKIDTTGRRHLFRTKSDIVCKQWLHAIGLASQHRPPGPLPGEAGFDPSSLSTTSHNYCTIPSIYSTESSSMGANVAPGLNDRELQKKVTLMQRTGLSFSALHRKKDRKERKQGDASANPRPESVGAELSASSDGRVYDDFKTTRPQWYLGKITRCSAEDYLQEQLPGTFLVRDSETVKSSGAYTLSLRHFERCRHHKIETTEQGTLFIKGHDHKTFPTLELLVEFFIQSQRKEIELKPYLPSMVKQSPDAEPGEDDEPVSPSRTVGDGCEAQTEESQQLEKSLTDPQAMTVRTSYENMPSKEKVPPPLPTRKSEPVVRGYENIPEKAAIPSPNEVPTPPDGYQNIPPKDAPQLPTRQPSSPRGYQNVPSRQTPNLGDENTPGKRNSDVPQLPTRPPPSPRGYQNVPPKQTPNLGYENTPGKRNSGTPIGTSPGIGYENIPPGEAVNSPPPLPPRVAKPGGYENVPEKGGPQSLPRDASRRSYQNLPPQIQPRPRKVSAATPAVSARPRPPAKRSETLPNLYGHGEPQ